MVMVMVVVVVWLVLAAPLSSSSATVFDNGVKAWLESLYFI
jgi:cytochrome c oxidase assembly factor CtaG